MINFRVADSKDAKKILRFIYNYWSKEHVFVKHPQLFYYMHAQEERLNYIIAVDENEKIYGICGFIFSNSEPEPDIWIALWKVIPSGNPMLGINMMQFLRDNVKNRSVSCCGITAEVIPLYEFMGFNTYKMKHFYMLNEKNEYKVAVIKNKKINECCNFGRYNLNIVSEKDFEKRYSEYKCLKKDIPFKDYSYIKKRYFQNPFYKYVIWEISSPNDNFFDTFIVGREIEVNNTLILRIVDFIGEEDKLSQTGSAFKKLLFENDYEYIDFLEYGLKDDTLSGLGFVMKEEDDKNIIPNWFEPFVQKNIDINIATDHINHFKMYKADGDQDRPNIL